MFNSEKKEQSEKRTYDVNVINVRKTKNEAILMLDLDVNGVKIYSCIFKEVTVKKDGEKHKKGDKHCFPSPFSPQSDNASFSSFSALTPQKSHDGYY